MSDLLETLRALAPVVTPGPWLRSNDPKKWVSSLAPVTSEEWRDNGDNDASAIITLRNALPAIIAALEIAQLATDEDWLAERISDSLDVDWRPIDAARAIIAALPKETDNDHD